MSKIQLRIIATLVGHEPVHVYESRLYPGRPMESALLVDEAGDLENLHHEMMAKCRLWRIIGRDTKCSKSKP